MAIVPDDVPPALSFRRCSNLTSITFIGSQELGIKEPPKYLCYSLTLAARWHPSPLTAFAAQCARAVADLVLGDARLHLNRLENELQLSYLWCASGGLGRPASERKVGLSERERERASESHHPATTKMYKGSRHEYSHLRRLPSEIRTPRSSTKLNTISDYTRQKAKTKYRNRIRFERESEKQSGYTQQSSDTHTTPYDRVKRCQGRKKYIKASERVNLHESVKMSTLPQRRNSKLSHELQLHVPAKWFHWSQTCHDAVGQSVPGSPLVSR
ncbi:hypothetical protein PR048_028572 [Dryococelus australis]|uniref:Uncharacterized protein n=1 Tax=Dryococelus australis TaxID=614101 RepID=A0ABQ9GAX9_9NEOP|nr:hypothetical protein PR048_028572 [Dryococelus australis]